MNITKAKSELISSVKHEYSLSYDDERDVEEGDVILVYGRRFIRNGKAEWKVEKIYRENKEISFNDEIDEDKGRQQLILKMNVDVVEKREHKFTDISTVDRREIIQEKEYIKDTIIQLWRLGWSNKYIAVNSNYICDIDNSTSNPEKIRPVNEDDFKITTVNGRGKAMHLAHSSINQDYNYRLGVNWVKWHRMSDSERLKILTHELCHCIHQNHKEIFFKEHANFIAELFKNEGRKERVEALFNDKIDWNKVKTFTLHGVHSQPKEINTSGHPHRRSACNSVVEKLENILDYKYEVGNKLYRHPPTDEIYPVWTYNAIYNEQDYNSEEDTRPDNIQLKKIDELNYSSDYTDKELFDYLMSLKVTDNNRYAFVYEKDEVPVINDNNVISNDIIVCLYDKLTHNSSQKGFNEDVSIPIVEK